MWLNAHKTPWEWTSCLPPSTLIQTLHIFIHFQTQEAVQMSAATRRCCYQTTNNAADILPETSEWWAYQDELSMSLWISAPVMILKDRCQWWWPFQKSSDKLIRIYDFTSKCTTTTPSTLLKPLDLIAPTPDHMDVICIRLVMWKHHQGSPPH